MRSSVHAAASPSSPTSLKAPNALATLGGMFTDERVLLLHVVAQFYAATSLLLGRWLYVGAPEDKIKEAIGVANGALCVCLVGLALLLQRPRERSRLYFGVISQYHAGVSFLQLQHPLAEMPWWAAPVFHGVLAFWFGARALRRSSARGQNAQACTRS